MSKIHAAISKQQQPVHPEAAFIIAGDFNHSNLKTVLRKFHRHVSSHTTGDKTLDHMYTNKPSNSTQTAMNVSFLNERNDFYARFDKDNKEKSAEPYPSTTGIPSLLPP